MIVKKCTNITEDVLLFQTPIIFFVFYQMDQLLPRAEIQALRTLEVKKILFMPMKQVFLIQVDVMIENLKFKFQKDYQ